MNAFISDKIPFVLAALIGLIGWLATTLLTEYQERKILSYRLDTNRSGYVVLTVWNSSKEKEISGLDFFITCSSHSGSCFQKLIGRNDYYSRTVQSPHYNQDITNMSEDEKKMLSFRASIPAGGSLKLRFHMVEIKGAKHSGRRQQTRNYAKPLFYVNINTVQDVYVTPESFGLYVLRNDIDALLVAAAITFFVIVVYFLGDFMQRKQRDDRMKTYTYKFEFSDD
jgi:hypothetical protein